MKTVEGHDTDSEVKRGFITRVLSAGKLKTLLFIAAVGIILGNQIYDPTKRVIEAVIGIIIVGLLWNFSTLGAIWLMVVMYPFPFGMSLGSSNYFLTILIFILHMIRVSAGQYKMHSEKLLNLPIILMVLSYILSLYNLPMDPDSRKFAYLHTSNFFATVLFFYLLVNLINDEEKLEKTVKLMMVSLALIVVFAFIELLFPGRTIIPGWLGTRHRIQLVMRGIRVGGPFRDYELLSEYAAINIPIVFFMIIRARRLLTRIIFTVLLMLTMFMLLTTATRGGLISLIAGLIYMIVLSGRDFGYVKTVATSVAVVAALIVIQLLVQQYTVAGSLFDRLVGTTVAKGFIPDTRYDAWGISLERAMEHPLIGHGPAWDFSKGIYSKVWPHSIYLYYMNITGIFGLFTFLFILYRLMRATLMGLKQSLSKAPFAEAFMKILHISLVIFILDEIKIDYLRNIHYSYFVWLLFGIIMATRNIILKKQREQTLPAPSS